MPNALDLTGRRFGRLTAISRVRDDSGRLSWQCKCDCGNTSTVLTNRLTSSMTKSCGCLQQEHREEIGELAAGISFRDLSGERFHKLVVLSWGGWSSTLKNHRESTWNCQCDCGQKSVVLQRNLVGGKTKSCGCIVGKHKRTHGATVGGKASPEFMAWGAMHQRCENPRSKSFKDYGARGIKVCERWATFEAFMEDVGPRPSPDHSLDRYPNNNGNYEPGNCRWATDKEQSNNRRSSRTLTINGETKTLAQWERQAGLSAGTVFRRLKAGWPPEAVISPDIQQGTRQYNGGAR